MCCALSVNQAECHLTDVLFEIIFRIDDKLLGFNPSELYIPFL